MSLVKKVFFFLILCIILYGVLMLLFSRSTNHIDQQQNIASITPMKLTSSAFAHNQSIPTKYTCDGENVNPPLTITNTPAGAKGLVLMVDDPDAPRGDWVHWTVWNIAPNTKEITENNVPENALQGMTDFGKPGYGGPCPPTGTHRYQFKLYALDTTLAIPASARKKDIEQAMLGHILDQTMLMGLYQRQ